MAYVSSIQRIIDINSHCVRIGVNRPSSYTGQITYGPSQFNKTVIPAEYHKYVNRRDGDGDGMDAYLLDTPQEEILQGRPIKFDFTNEFKEGRPILHVQKLGAKHPNGSFFNILAWGVSVDSMLESIDKYTGMYDRNGIHVCDLGGVRQLFTLQTMIIKDLQEKVNALTPQEQKPNMEDPEPRMGVQTLQTSLEEKPDPFEEEVQRRLAKELYEQRVNAEVQRRLAAMSASKAEDGINKVFEEWKEVPIFKNLASLLNPKNVTTDGA